MVDVHSGLSNFKLIRYHEIIQYTGIIKFQRSKPIQQRYLIPFSFRYSENLVKMGKGLSL